jgi:8-oxo-dGTP pyrophosphatase MutT (NUDIX family)
MLRCTRELAEEFGISHPDDNFTYCVNFFIDPGDVFQQFMVKGINVGRNPAETLRVLVALQTDQLCPCNWSEGKDVLRPAAQVWPKESAASATRAAATAGAFSPKEPPPSYFAANCSSGGPVVRSAR